ncbi:zinc-dependent alcohol dehydrogenase [Aliiruegeria lutimaris]|uniref:2-desacetyl-2-hydroxyethyl bacteriochlorophyllide A dehydrogenase n=1 Tax=Aliiruegeria lutimaris TaxID=571298 RepID=A0A1G8WS09_9RHOB|nr:alcohol dehydrogenase catalytic domain-containing protein [Aliiruegeria lutimaris]SDJ80837.1 2-desacetyl-2-hydroxyethyl bacteriochlorophyllide A dehydrogenase [Aliiruegeria lutimaris]
MTITAAFYRGDKTFEVKQIEAEAPGAGQVQIEVAFCGICGTDLHAYLGHMDARIGFDRILGHEMSGVVKAIGEGVEGWKEGDRIVVRPLDHCGDCPACNRGHKHICHNLKFIGLDSQGAMQQLWNVPAHTLHAIPENVSLRDASLIEPLAVACHDVRMSNVTEGEDVLVIGGGPIGMLVAMVAKAAGGKVTISEINENRLALARKLGFETINPKEVDAVAEVLAKTGDKGADVIFEVSGTQPGIDLMTAVGATRARIVMVAIHATKPQVDMFRFFWRELQLIGVRVYEPEDYDKAIASIAAGEIDADAMITDIRPLDKIGEAFAELIANPNAMKSLLQING